jgi:hypothetical protein
MDIIADVTTSIPANFRVKITRMPYALDRDVLDYVTLTIGSARTSCVNISIPVRETMQPMWLDHIDASKSSAPCTLDATAVKTKDMFHFAASILRQITPKTVIEFTDQSQIPCTIADAEVRNVPLNLLYLMFYGKTWYDSLFGAHLVDAVDQAKYEQLQARRKDPAYKPASFNFKTAALNEELAPLYARTATWEEFFNVIKDTYGDRKCKMVYMWLASAVQTLTVGGNDVFGFPRWAIDISSFPPIYFSPLRSYRGGATRRARKARAGGRSRKNTMAVYETLANPQRDMIPRGVDYALFSLWPKIDAPFAR